MTAAGRAYETIRARIIGGTYPERAHLRETELARDMGLSRTPIREALRQLANEGYLDYSPQHGAFVPSWGSEKVGELYDLRAMLEGQCATLAAGRITPELLRALRGLTAAMEAACQAGEAGLDELGRLNRQFHEAIMSAAGNERLKAATLQAIEQLPYLHRSFRRYEPLQWERSMRHHADIVDAFSVGDATWAGAAMCAHILAGKHQIQR